jgi:hypothetical protein
MRLDNCELRNWFSVSSCVAKSGKAGTRQTNATRIWQGEPNYWNVKKKCREAAMLAHEFYHEVLVTVSYTQCKAAAMPPTKHQQQSNNIHPRLLKTTKCTLKHSSSSQCRRLTRCSSLFRPFFLFASFPGPRGISFMRYFCNCRRYSSM